MTAGNVLSGGQLTADLGFQLVRKEPSKGFKVVFSDHVGFDVYVFGRITHKIFTKCSCAI